MSRPAHLSLALITLLTLSACTQEEEAPPPPPVRPVLSLIVAPQPDAALGFTGTVEPRYSRDLGFRVLGRMIARDVDIGDPVMAGQLLASLDPMALDLTVRQLEAELAKAEAQLVNATATRDRQQALLTRNASTQADLDTAEEARASAAAAAARGRASLDKAKEQLSYTRLMSETDGIVTAVNAEVGQTVTAGQTVVTVAQVEVREAVVDIPDETAQAIRRGDPYDAILQIDPRIRAKGTVREIAPQADAATRTRRVRITLDKPPETFRVGTTVTATPRITSLSAIDLPGSALLRQDDKAFVWVVDEKAMTVSRREVAIASETGGAIRIGSGIDMGARVVTAGVHTLTEGQAVKINQEIVP